MENIVKLTPVGPVADPFADLESDFDAGLPPEGSDPATDYLVKVGEMATKLVGVRAKSIPAPKVPCPRCGGTGKWRGYGDCVGDRTCLKCGGTGRVKGLKMDPKSVAAREKSKAKREQARIDRHRDFEARKAQYREEHPAEIEWLHAKVHARTGYANQFAESLWNGYQQYGSLTDRQLAAVTKIVAQDKARQSEQEARRQAQVAAAPSMAGEGFTKLVDSFKHAKAAGLKFPKIRIAEFVISMASDTSKNPGCLYIKAGNGFNAPYMGKVTPDGHFLKGRDCTPEQEARIIQIGKDPLAEAVAHGKKTGRCSCCGAELTNALSISLGIGPICREKFGW